VLLQTTSCRVAAQPTCPNKNGLLKIVLKCVGRVHQINPPFSYFINIFKRPESDGPNDRNMGMKRVKSGMDLIKLEAAAVISPRCIPLSALERYVTVLLFEWYGTCHSQSFSTRFDLCELFVPSLPFDFFARTGAVPAAHTGLHVSIRPRVLLHGGMRGLTADLCPSLCLVSKR
jgi:hypothetical protein